MRVNRANLNVSVAPVPTVRINRIVVISTAAVVVLVLLLAIISAFTTNDSNSSKQSKSDNGMVGLNSKESKLSAQPNHLALAPELKMLPESYTDVSGINRFVFKSDADNRLEILARQFEELQSEYRYLKEQIESKGDTAKNEPDSAATLAAKNGEIVFNNLGSSVEDPFSGRSSLTNKKEETPIATPAQVALIKSEEENKRRLELARGEDSVRNIYEPHNVIKPVSKYQLQAGSLIPAVLTTGIDNTTIGSIIAHVKSDIYDTVSGKYLLIPKGSKLIGEYDSRVVPGQRRILIEFGRIIRPDGSSVLLNRALGADAIGQSGVTGNVDNHWARILGAATVSTILTVGAGMGADYLTNDDRRGGESAANRALRSGSDKVSEVGSALTQQAMSIKPTITVPPGTSFNIVVRKDIVLDPIKQKSRKVLKKHKKTHSKRAIGISE